MSAIALFEGTNLALKEKFENMCTRVIFPENISLHFNDFLKKIFVDESYRPSAKQLSNVFFISQ